MPTRLVDESGWIICGGLANLREARGRDGLGEAFGDDLACVEQLRSGLEGHDHRREPGQRHGLDLVQERDPHQQVLLERHRDQLLHLLGGEPEGLRLHLDGRPLELGQDVRPGVVELQDAVDEHPAPPGRPPRRRNLMLDPMIQRIIAAVLLARWVWACSCLGLCSAIPAPVSSAARPKRDADVSMARAPANRLGRGRPASRRGWWWPRPAGETHRASRIGQARCVRRTSSPVFPPSKGLVSARA